jgi:hypothetical protein
MPRTIRSRGRLLALMVPVLTAVLAMAGGLARAQQPDDLHREMAELARQVKGLLDQKGNDAIAVGDFRGPARLASSGGPAIAKTLIEALKALGVSVKRLAALEINGEYRDVEDGKTHLLALEIKAHIVDRAGAEIVEFEPRGLFSVPLIVALTSPTVALPPGADDKERNDVLADNIGRNPKVHLAGSRISTQPKSPYAIEVLVKEKGEFVPRAATNDDGLAFVKIGRGETYAVKLINDSPFDAAVVLTIDGLNVFAFSENKNYSFWIVPSKQTLTIPGWHRTNAKADSFLVTEYARSAVAEALPNSASVGTITASFSAAWPQGANPPEDEAPSKKGGRAGDATGHGPETPTSFVEVVREIGRLRDAVSVRYTKTGDDVKK